MEGEKTGAVGPAVDASVLEGALRAGSLERRIIDATREKTDAVGLAVDASVVIRGSVTGPGVGAARAGMGTGSGSPEAPPTTSGRGSTPRLRTTSKRLATAIALGSPHT